MKQGKPVITLVMVLFALTLCVYFGFYVFETFNDPFSTTTVYEYTHTESTRANGVLIRAEEILPAREGIVELRCAEGEKVAVGQTVAHVYQTDQARRDQASLEELEEQILLLEEVAASGTGLEGAAKLDEDILRAVAELRSAVAARDLSQLEEQTRAVKRCVLQRGYTYEEGVTGQELKDQLTRSRQEYQALSSQLSGTYSRVRAGVSGVFSALVDSLETVLTPETAMTLTPAVLEGYLDAEALRVEAVGKLITENRWYFAANLPVEVAGTLKVGRSATLCFTGSFHQNVDMRVDYISPPEGDTVTVTFSTDRYLGQTTLLRRQSAELIFADWSGLRVPKRAVHMDKYTVETEEGQKEEHRLGVYALVAGRAEFKPVEIVTESDNFYILRPTDPQRSDALRAGDEIIVRATGLYDGKLMEY